MSPMFLSVGKAFGGDFEYSVSVGQRFTISQESRHSLFALVAYSQGLGAPERYPKALGWRTSRRTSQQVAVTLTRVNYTYIRAAERNVRLNSTYFIMRVGQPH
jgi:hypothetical protein